MFRSIRRKKKEISLDLGKQLLHENRIGVLAVNGEDGYPYCMPLNYYYDEENNKVYFHGARAGYKSDMLKLSDKVCFTVYGKESVKDLEWAPYCKSAILFGRCHLLENNAETMALLKTLAMKYYPSEEAADEEIAHDGKAVQVFELEIEHMTAKEIQEK